MKTLILAAMLAFCWLPACANAAGKSITELMSITQAGGSLIIDLDKKAYSATELAALAASLKFEATLTIKSATGKLSTTQCIQIARARPGHVVFWF